MTKKPGSIANGAITIKESACHCRKDALDVCEVFWIGDPERVCEERFERGGRGRSQRGRRRRGSRGRGARRSGGRHKREGRGKGKKRVDGVFIKEMKRMEGRTKEVKSFVKDDCIGSCFLEFN